jgi:hypothetical protein
MQCDSDLAGEVVHHMISPVYVISQYDKYCYCSRTTLLVSDSYFQ